MVFDLDVEAQTPLAHAQEANKREHALQSLDNQLQDWELVQCHGAFRLTCMQQGRGKSFQAFCVQRVQNTSTGNTWL